MKAITTLQNAADRLEPFYGNTLREIAGDLQELIGAAKNVAGRKVMRGAHPTKQTLLKDRLRRALSKFDSSVEA